MMSYRPADTVLVGKSVITMEDDAGDDFAAVAIVGDRITRLLRRDEVNEAVGPNTRVIDTGNAAILPGFIDVHAHAEVACRISQSAVDCRAPECGTVDDVQQVLAAACRETEAGAWVVGQANLFFDRKLKEGRLPTRAELDAVSTSHPIALRAGGHITVLNTRALEVSGIDRNYTPPSHSVTGLPQVERDSSGDPTGIIKEMDSLLPLPRIEGDHLRRVLEDGIKDVFTRFGVTAIGEISETVEGLHQMESLAASGRLASAIRPYLWAPGTMSLDEACNWREQFQDNGSRSAFKIQGLKLFSDGGYSARSAAVNHPYLCSCQSHPPFRGDIALTESYTREAFEKTQKAGLQMAVHANGDRAQEWLCDVITSMGGAPGGALRSRIEHAGNLMPERRTSDKWAEAGIIPVPQPVFLYTFGGYFPDYLGEFGRRGRFAFASLLRRGWHLTGSSDVWIGSEREATNPLFSIWCCLKRETYAGEVLDPEEAITIRQALRMHTIDAAAVLGEADLRGSLAPGKLADIVVLDRNPEQVEVDALRTIAVQRVFSAGREVWSITSEPA